MCSLSSRVFLISTESLLIADIIGASSIDKFPLEFKSGAGDMGQQRKDAREHELLLHERREGQWTKLQLLEMDERFQAAVRRELAETEPVAAQAEMRRNALIDQ